jgi:hypothetical protein
MKRLVTKFSKHEINFISQNLTKIFIVITLKISVFCTPSDKKNYFCTRICVVGI